jgi:2-methylcitrate dehydratase PrpD
VTTSALGNHTLSSSQLLGRLFERCAVASDTARSAAARSLFDYCACITGASPAVSTWACEHAGRLAFAAHRRDQDDLHHDSVTHPGGVVWSAVVAVALERQASWADTVDAAVLGYELVVRIAEGFPQPYRQRWHATTVAGTIGAAAAAARLLGGEHSAVLDAIGHASSVTSGSAQAQVERTGTRLVHRAFAASTGVMCARAATSGLDGNEFGLQGDRGALTSASATVADAVLRERESLALAETGFRLYPVNGFAHAAIDAAGRLGPIRPDELERVTVTIAPAAGVGIASNATPSTDDEAWWSVEHAVALALAGGGPQAVHAGLSGRADVVRLCSRTHLHGGDDGWGATVEIDLRDGTSRAASATEPLGHARRPATDGDLCAKWRRLTGSDGSRLLERLYTAPPTASLRSILPSSDTIARQ